MMDCGAISETKFVLYRTYNNMVQKKKIYVLFFYFIADKTFPVHGRVNE